MNKFSQNLMKENVKLEVSGKKLLKGTVIELGSNVMVIFDGVDFVYIPLHHIQNLQIAQKDEFDIHAPTELPNIIPDTNQEEISFQQVLIQAKGKNVEIYVTNSLPLHGNIQRIMDDYVVFYSPVYKTMYIPIHHLKWLIPYFGNESHYGMDDENSHLQSNTDLVENNFVDQVKTFKNALVVLNVGGNKSNIGKLIDIQDQLVVLQKAREIITYLHLDHIKTIHQV